MTVLILILGFLFGAALQYARLNKFNVISGLAILENFTVAKAIAIAIGTGAILINIEIALGFASFHVKPFILGGIVIGGLIFGIGMAILGYCPGTLAISLGEGSVDALIGIIGGLTGGVVYTLILPVIEPVLGPNLGTLSLNSITGTNIIFYILLFVVGGIFIALSFVLHRYDREKSRNWIYSGIALAVLNVIVFSSSITDRVIGASTTYPYLGNLIVNNTGSEYFNKITASGQWELIFLGGAFAAGLIISLIRKDFRIRLIHENWMKFKGPSQLKRAFWAFAGGFLLITGARLAGGCTSGHVLSGGMQLSLSSLAFAVFVFTGLLATGRLFYKR